MSAPSLYYQKKSAKRAKEPEEKGVMKWSRSNQQDVEVTSLDSRAQRHLWRRYPARWLRSWTGRITLSTLTLLIILGSLAAMLARATPDPLGAVKLAFGGPTPTATPLIPPGGDVLGLSNWVPWGDLRIDGRAPALRTIAPIGTGFTLPRSAHHLMYQARYFPTLNCVITVPRSTSDTCPLANSAPIAGVSFQRILDLEGTPARMRRDQYNLLLSSVESTLSQNSATTTIQPGERYIDQSGQLEVAQTAMTFTVSAQIEEQPGTTCPVLCSITTDANPPGSTGPWYLGVQVTPEWTVTDAAGQTFVSPLSSHEAPSQMTLTATPSASGWSVAHPDADLLNSFVAGAAVKAVAGNTEINSGNSQGGPGVGATSGANPADGAVAVFNDAPAGQRVILLWRFGVLYAANAEAARLYPTLPLANAQEQAMAQAMAAGLQS